MGRKAHADAQHVPSYVIAAATLLIPVAVAVVNHIMVLSDLQLMELKFTLAQDVMVDSGLMAGVAVLVGLSVSCAIIATCLVSFGDPISAGSGIPEVLGFLNGNSLPGLFTLRGFFVRVVAIVFVQVAGFPVGREGPMVAIGGSVGFGVAWLLLRSTEMRWEQVDASATFDDTDTCKLNLASTPLVLNEERFAYVRRVGCALGGAAGIATAFNAPIGAILYMFEELAVSSLPPELSKFMCTVFSALAARACLQMTDMDVHRLVIYDASSKSATGAHGTWDWYDIPLMVVLSLVLGLAGALFAKFLLASWSFRRRTASKLADCQPWAKIVECIVYCTIVTLAWGLVPSFFGCVEDPSSSASSGGHAGDGHRLLSSDTHLEYVRYACPEGQYNEVATYLISGAEGTVKHLYALGGEVQRSGPLAVTLVLYLALACGMPGLAVPMGTFVPSMLAGALAGRLFGENMNVLHSTLHLGGPHLAPAGVYAVVGSAAMLAGLTHMTVGVVALLAEAIGDFDLIAPLMLAVFVAQTASKRVSHLGYDEHLIIMKGIPFLDPEIPKEMETQGIIASDICELLPDEALLPPKATMKAIKRAIRQRPVKYFPIIAEGSICIGLTTRGRLEAVLEAVKASKAAAARAARLIQRRPSIDSTGSAASVASTISSASLTSNASSASGNSGCGRTRCTPSISSPCRISSGMGFGVKASAGGLHDVQTEAKVASFIKVMFSGQRKKDTQDKDDDNNTSVEELLPVDRIMDSAPHAICEDMPVSRFYHFFNKTGANVCIVVSKRGKFRGILSRTGLINAQAKLHAGYQFKAAGAQWTACNGEQSAGCEESCGDDGKASVVPGELALGAQHHSSSSKVASAVASNMSAEELQAALTNAWRKISDGEKKQDELIDHLRASDEKIRQLQLRLGDAQALHGAPVVPDPADADAKSRRGGSHEQHLKKHIVLTCATARCFW